MDNLSELRDLIDTIRDRIEALEANISAEISLAYETLDAITTILDEADEEAPF